MMCKVCDKLDSMIDCLETLHSVEELREAMMSMTDDEETLQNMKEMDDEDIRIEFAVNLFIHWVDKYEACPLEVIGKAALKYNDRIHAHMEVEDE